MCTYQMWVGRETFGPVSAGSKTRAEPGGPARVAPLWDGPPFIIKSRARNYDFHGRKDPLPACKHQLQGCIVSVQACKLNVHACKVSARACKLNVHACTVTVRARANPALGAAPPISRLPIPEYRFIVVNEPPSPDAPS